MCRLEQRSKKQWKTSESGTFIEPRGFGGEGVGCEFLLCVRELAETFRTGGGGELQSGVDPWLHFRFR